MKWPKWKTANLPSTALFTFVCFFVGYFAVTILSFGRVAYDDREGPGWSPISKMPDGKTGLSQSALETIGFFALGAGLAALLGLAYVWIHELRPLVRG